MIRWKQRKMKMWREREARFVASRGIRLGARVCVFHVSAPCHTPFFFLWTLISLKPISRSCHPSLLNSLWFCLPFFIFVPGKQAKGSCDEQIAGGQWKEGSAAAEVEVWRERESWRVIRERWQVTSIKGLRNRPQRQGPNPGFVQAQINSSTDGLLS